ncbi:hypothetical protein [Streptomyces thermolilacinus]|uniref:hypothetical protein n=1 Tax=Streptomyces thermolilacinus TaxID=285540 RepID=UPI0033FB5611
MNHHDEDALRRGLRALADDDGTAEEPPPTGALVARGRRTRHRRRALAAGAATTLVAAGAVLGVRWTAPAPDAAAAPTTAAEGSATATERSAPASRTGGPDDLMASAAPGGVHLPQPPSAEGGALDSGPRRHPVHRVRYRYDLSAVCGMRYAVFGGRVWEAPAVDRAASWISDRARGFMRLTTAPGQAPTAVFESEGPGPRGIVFRPLAGTTPPCLAQEPPRRYSDTPAATVGPAKPEEGAVYAFDWPTACERRYIAFAGRLWEADAPFAPEALLSLPHRLPIAAYARIVDGRLQVTTANPLTEPGADVSAYRPVDRGDDTYRTRCTDTLGTLEHIARGTAAGMP